MKDAEPDSPSPLVGEGLGRGGRPTRRSAALGNAKLMRSQPTDSERRLWTLLRAKRLSGHKFRRQVLIGKYIVDFVCFDARLIVEADGSQHFESSYDQARDAWLTSQGFRVMRFWNSDILSNGMGVMETILNALQSIRSGVEPDRMLSPLPNPSPARGEGL